MKISGTYSHINGLEYLLVHRPEVWHELQIVVATADSESCKVEMVGEETTKGVAHYSSIRMRKQFHELLKSAGWKEGRVDYWAIGNEELARETLEMASKDQRQRIEAAGEIPIQAYNQADFVRDRVAVEVQFGNHAYAAYDLFVKHLAFYIRNQIDVGIEILPMKSLQSQMGSDLPCFETEIYNVVRHGRTVPAVPLVMLGIEP
jgi:hypothetical protein